MFSVMVKLVEMLANPSEFFSKARSEGWRPAFKFFLSVTLILSIVTPILNYLGMESTDFSSSYQAQILAYRLVKNNLINLYGAYAYLLEAVLILAFAIPILLFLTLMTHLIYRLLGGEGSILNAWKAACYGVGPCLIGGFLPYISLFAAFYSLAMQSYLGPMTLYKAKEGRVILVFVVFTASVFIEMFTRGTTVSI